MSYVRTHIAPCWQCAWARKPCGACVHIATSTAHWYECAVCVFQLWKVDKNARCGWPHTTFALVERWKMVSVINLTDDQKETGNFSILFFRHSNSLFVGNRMEDGIKYRFLPFSKAENWLLILQCREKNGRYAVFTENFVKKNSKRCIIFCRSRSRTPVESISQNKRRIFPWLTMFEYVIRVYQVTWYGCQSLECYKLSTIIWIQKYSLWLHSFQEGKWKRYHESVQCT